MTYALWFLQTVLALLFLFAGGLKLVVPVEALGMPFLLPAVFVRFIGMCEVLGALGLILPGLLRIKTSLTPLAATGLAIIMIGATAVSMKLGVAAAIPPFVVGLLLVFVAYGRSRLVPHSSKRPAK